MTTRAPATALPHRRTAHHSTAHHGPALDEPVVWTYDHAPAGVVAAMVAEGLLVAVLPGVWVPTDLVRDRGTRAAALAALLRDAGVRTTAGPSPAVVAGTAAAWVHGCARAPRRVDVLVPRGTGGREVGPVVRLLRVADPTGGAVRVDGPDGAPVLVLTGTARTAEDLRAAGRHRVDGAVRAWLAAAQSSSSSAADADGPAATAGGVCSPRRPGER